MSEPFQNKQNGIPQAERLRVTEKYIAELRGVLSEMDEIAALRRGNGEPDSDEVGGYKRSSVERMLEDLEKQRDAILAERAPKRAERAAAPVRMESGLSQNAAAGFMRGDNTLAIESVYTGLSMDIEKLREEILQELKYTYKQDMAIYEDLAGKIEGIRRADLSALEEKFAPLFELAKQLEGLQPFDYDALAERVEARFSFSGERVAALEGKIDELHRLLGGALDVHRLPEFRRLDSAVADYREDLSYEHIPDILQAAVGAKRTADRYLAGGNTLRAEAMIYELGMRLESVEVSGSAAIIAADDAVHANKLPVTYSEEACKAFIAACTALEQAPAPAGEDVAVRVLRTKNTLFSDVSRREKDRTILSEMAEIGAACGESGPTEEQVAAYAALKRRLMTFDLAGFVDLSPAAESAPAAAGADTDVILAAIRELSAKPTQQPVRAEKKEGMPLPADGRPAPKARSLRPAVSAKDNRVEQTRQPLRVVHRSVSLTDENPDALSKKQVEDLAMRIASNRKR